VIDRHHVIAVDALGAIRWENHEASEIAGAAVTTDHHLLVAAGAELAAYDLSGKRMRLLTVEDTFATAPATGADGELFIAGSRSLYRIY
jgi:hypothetical protein